MTAHAQTTAVEGVFLKPFCAWSAIGREQLAIWFAVHVAFAEVDTVQAYGMQLLVPALGSVQIASIVLALGAFVAMLRFKIGMLPVIAVSALLGIAYQWFMQGVLSA